MSKLALEVTRIIKAVEQDRDMALVRFTRKFDGVNLTPRQFTVTPDEMRKSYKRIPKELRSALLTAKERIERFHRAELSSMTESWSVETGGIRAGQKCSAILRAGIYVPGGRFCYPSTVLMACIPAKIAGVKEIIIATPPKNARDEILAAAHICGVTRLYRIGGPAAIAALAIGTRTVPKVDIIAGPGNAYVTEAKRQVFGKVGIDSLAGPSEVAIWADAKCNLSRVVANLCAQAEHGPDSRAYLLSSSERVIAEARRELPKQFKSQVTFLRFKSEREIPGKLNEIAPEHLLLAVKSARKRARKICNAGAIFIGDKTPVALGDYSAGPSHVLPTGGAARFASAVSVKTFMKWSSVIENVSKKAGPAFSSAKTLSRAEGLYRHALSLE